MSERLWYAGLPVVGTRSLAPEEVEEIGALIRRSTGFTVLSIGIVLLTFALVLAAIANVSFALLLFFVNGLLPRLVPGFLPAWRLGPLRRDRDAGTVYVCESAGNDQLSTGKIDVLPQSRIVLRSNGNRPAKLTLARLTTTAPVPQHAAAAANFVRPLNDNEKVLVHQRPLSEDELRELDSYAPAVEPVRVVLTTVAIIGTIVTFVLALEGRITSLFAPFAFALIASVTGTSTFRAWRLRRRIAGDVAHAYVLIVRIRDGETLSVPHEFLPHSRILWTSAGEPANWRKVVSAR